MELLPSGDYRYRVTDRQGQESVVPRGEIWHLRGLSSDGMMGLSPIDLARESLGMALAACRHPRYGGGSINGTGRVQRRSCGGGFMAAGLCCRGW